MTRVLPAPPTRPGTMRRTVARLAAGAAALLLVSPAFAQLESEGKGSITMEVGQGTAPVAGVAAQVVDQQTGGPRGDRHAGAFRLVAGYQFSETFSSEFGVAHVAPMRSTAPYLAHDTLITEVSLTAVEGDLVAHFPLAPALRVNVSVGLADTALRSDVSTSMGSSLPVGQRTSDTERRFGATAGVTVEVRLTDVSSVEASYRVYPHTGSGRLPDSVSATVQGLFLGVHFEF